ncbi:hypothetical protein EZS27_005360 [termite gut metagenome]|uniref:Uncharacterized protein n=1 Tax=termite gut metagenome TaxID=433724 RepID=A0A5J4SP07_9ZZZZ
MKREEKEFIRLYQKKYGVYPNRLWILLLRITLRFGYVALLELAMGVMAIAIACVIIIGSVFLMEWLLHVAQCL